jgi:hypothetical protein
MIKESHIIHHSHTDFGYTELPSTFTTPDQILILDRPEVPCESIAMREITSDDMFPVDAGAQVKLMGCQGVVSVEKNS